SRILHFGEVGKVLGGWIGRRQREPVADKRGVFQLDGQVGWVSSAAQHYAVHIQLLGKDLREHQGAVRSLVHPAGVQPVVEEPDRRIPAPDLEAQVVRYAPVELARKQVDRLGGDVGVDFQHEVLVEDEIKVG